jgi:hypothetical protein
MTPTNVAVKAMKQLSLAETGFCLHSEEKIAFADRGYLQKNRTLEYLQAEDGLTILVQTKKPKGCELNEQHKQSNRVLSAIRAVVEHPFRVIKRQFGFVKVRYRGLKKEHGADGHSLCTGQPGAGAQEFLAPHGRGTPMTREMPQKSPCSCGQL